ncbi:MULTISPECIES: type II toxin-antitoxin system Phd/YefM family antitoxin [unclassified Ensifer]|uniref:type II toxin-antitoxin system Phd/YefM family antitoxin n=1 Tax=unclassified Ensifer TaxID=2633371 RepID=UPI003010550B
MPLSTITSRAMCRSISIAKELAKSGPVLITDRGKPSHVLLTYDEYVRVAGRRRSLVDALAMPGLSETDLVIPRAQIVPREAG